MSYGLFLLFYLRSWILKKVDLVWCSGHQAHCKWRQCSILTNFMTDDWDSSASLNPGFLLTNERRYDKSCISGWPLVWILEEAFMASFFEFSSGYVTYSTGVRDTSQERVFRQTQLFCFYLHLKENNFR